MHKLILAAALALSLAACDHKSTVPPIDATPTPGGQAPSSQDAGPVQQK